MSDNLQNRGPQDRSRINIHESWELEYWAKHFGVSKDKIKEAVARVGVSVSAVQKYLGK